MVPSDVVCQVTPAARRPLSLKGQNRLWSGVYICTGTLAAVLREKQNVYCNRPHLCDGQQTPVLNAVEMRRWIFDHILLAEGAGGAVRGEAELEHSLAHPVLPREINQPRC